MKFPFLKSVLTTTLVLSGFTAFAKNYYYICGVDTQKTIRVLTQGDYCGLEFYTRSALADAPEAFVNTGFGIPGVPYPSQSDCELAIKNPNFFKPLLMEYAHLPIMCKYKGVGSSVFLGNLDTGSVEPFKGSLEERVGGKWVPILSSQCDDNNSNPCRVRLSQ